MNSETKPDDSSFILHPSSFSTNELLRKTLHIGFGILAISLKYIPWRVAAVVAAAAVVLNWVVLHRLVGKRVARHERGGSVLLVENPSFRDGSIVSLWHGRDVLRSGMPILLMDADVL